MLRQRAGPDRRGSARTLPRLASLVVLACAVAPAAVRAQRPAPASPSAAPPTRAERTAFVETSRYADVIRFLEAVAADAPRIHVGSFGYTMEGRALPLAVVGRIEGADAASVRRAGGTRVLLFAGIHAGEACGKEALQILLRDLAAGRHAAWSDSLVLLVAPIYNADGNERVSLDHRPRQHGPLGGMGQRANAQGLDLNRDHMKLESPEARSLAGLLNDYDPHVVVDLHTTNGTVHAYHLTYSPPLHPSTDPGIVEFLRGEWLPAARAAVREASGRETYYYGNVPRGGDAQGPPRGWYTFDHRPRFNNNYVGLRNRFAILSEAYAYATFEERVLATKAFVHAVLDGAYRNATRIRTLVEAADARPVAGRRFAVRARHARSAEPVEILLGEVAEERHPYTGAPILRRLPVSRPERMYEYGTFEATESVVAPAAYLIPPGWADVVETLRAHGLRVDRVEASRAAPVERFSVDSTRVAERPFQGHRERTVFGRWIAETRPIAPGWVRVPTAQPLGLLAVALLEPRSDDGLVAWNAFDEAWEDGEDFPVLREPAAARP